MMKGLRYRFLLLHKVLINKNQRCDQYNYEYEVPYLLRKLPR